ncbi:MAG: hypothetical protein AMXMBFR34_36850 [Myxococcaceae bacterium]
MARPGDDFERGRKVGKYELVTRLSVGGMAELYLAMEYLAGTTLAADSNASAHRVAASTASPRLGHPAPAHLRD